MPENEQRIVLQTKSRACVLAAICSFFIPGLGQFIKKQPILGIITFLSVAIGGPLTIIATMANHSLLNLNVLWLYMYFNGIWHAVYDEWFAFGSELKQ